MLKFLHYVKFPLKEFLLLRAKDELKHFKSHLHLSIIDGRGAAKDLRTTACADLLARRDRYIERLAGIVWQLQLDDSPCSESGGWTGRRCHDGRRERACGLVFRKQKRLMAPAHACANNLGAEANLYTARQRLSSNKHAEWVQGRSANVG